MFKDLKEYQEITQLYHDSVNISEEQRAINTAIAEAEFTAEEIQYLDENFDELWEGELSTLTEEIITDCLSEENLNEEQIQEIVKKMAPVAAKTGGKAVKGIGGMLKKGFSAVKKAIPQGVKDTVKGAGSVAKSAMSKVGGVVKKVAPKLLKAAPVLGAGGLAVAGIAGGINALRKRGKKEREAKDDAAIKKGIEDAKKTGIKSGQTAQGGMSLKAREQAAFNRGERKARVDLKDPTLNSNLKKKEDPKPQVTEKPKKMHPIEKKNRARFGDEHVDKLKAKNKDFKLMRSKKMSKDDFIKKYPKSITAQKAAGLRDHTEWDAYDMVLEYLYSTEQVSSLEEANYVMMEMEQQTIGEIVKEVKSELNELMLLELKPGKAGSAAADAVKGTGARSAGGSAASGTVKGLAGKASANVARGLADKKIDKKIGSPKPTQPRKPYGGGGRPHGKRPPMGTPAREPMQLP